uniref:Protein aquasalis n=1 Tax=Xenopsylla cheopis TaxID=163159 RepID=A0A6M2DHD8_XENCH
MAEFGVGVAVPAKPSSRVLKPPGGGSSIFTGPEVKEQKPRNMKNQQNSTSMNEVMGTVDPNILISQKAAETKPEQECPKTAETPQEATAKVESKVNAGPQSAAPVNGTRGKVPPGGFSAGFW